MAFDLQQDFLGAGTKAATSYQVAFNDLGIQQGLAVHTAVNGISLDNGMDGQSQDLGLNHRTI